MQLEPEFPTDQLDSAIGHCSSIWQSLAGSRIFVTGATGFLGRWVLATLLRASLLHSLGIEIVCLTRSPERFAAELPILTASPSLKLISGDIRSFDFPPGQFTHLIHAAADTSAEADREQLVLFDSIVLGTRRVLEFASQAGIQSAVFTSSGAVYGPQPSSLERIPETYLGACPTDNPRSNYGTAKRAAEQLFTIFHRTDGISTKVARCFAFAGPHMSFDGHFAIGNFIRNAEQGEKIIVKGDGTPLRSYLYASDTAAWLLTILVNGNSGAVYNVGSDKAVSIGQLAELVSQLVPTANGYEVVGKPEPNASRSRYIPDISKARTVLGLDVWTGLDETILRTAAWLKRR